MKKHIREGLRLAGVPLGLVQLSHGSTGHVRIALPDRVITCSCSPRDPSTAAMRIARDIKKAQTITD